MRLSQEQINELKATMRLIIINKPRATILEIQQDLNRRFNHLYDKNFICELRNELHQDSAKRVNKATLNYVLAEFEDAMDELKKKCWQIINNKAYSVRTRIKAIRQLTDISHKVFNTMFDAGAFEEELNASKKPKNYELTPQQIADLERSLGFLFHSRKNNAGKWEDAHGNIENMA